MATVSLSPTPAPLSTMSTRRTPLSNNPNVANSPLRGAAALMGLAGHSKSKRSYANIQREEAYGQPPPLKKQMLDNTSLRLRSPLGRPRSQLVVQQQRSARIQQKERAAVAAPVSTASTATVPSGAESARKATDDQILNWRKQQREKFPKSVFYFDAVPNDVRAKLVKQVVFYGAREEKFFSIDVTTVVTGRSVPPSGRLGRDDAAENENQKDEDIQEQPQTINPSLLDRSSEARRKLLLDMGSRRAHHMQEDVVRSARPARNTDVLHRAQEMGKKIYSVEKLQRMLAAMVEVDSFAGYSGKNGTIRGHSASRNPQEPSLAQLLQHERLNGPSDRDPTAVSRELHYFKGPYIYVYDMDEKQKPMMVREYPKVADKTDGEWPQFRSVTRGRCPFVEEVDTGDRESRRQQRERSRSAKPVLEKAPSLQAPAPLSPRRVTGKRTREEFGDVLAETTDAQNKLFTGVRPTDIFNPVKQASKPADFTSQNFFTGRPATGRLFAGEPVASGVQPSNITSAIRSQMISSTSGINGAKAGTSKEVHCLQRKVLQKGAAPTSHDLSSRRIATEQSMEGPSSRLASIGKPAARLLDLIEEQEGKEKKATAAPRSQAAAPQKNKRDMKPGYCENCQDKFRDFDEHIVSRKHRKFAESEDNWLELDALLSLLERPRRNEAACEA